MLVKKGGKIDFENAIRMTDEQIEEFKSKCEDIFDEVEVEERTEPDRDVPDNEEGNNRWTPEEYALLIQYYGDKTEEEIAEMMDDRHSGRSVELKGGRFIQEFMKWWSEYNDSGKGVDDIEHYQKQVERFLEESDSF